MVHTWRSENIPPKLILLSYHAGSEDQNEASGSAPTTFSLESHLAGPSSILAAKAHKLGLFPKTHMGEAKN